MKGEILRNTKPFFLSIIYNFHNMYTYYENWKLDPAMAATKYEIANESCYSKNILSAG